MIIEIKSPKYGIKKILIDDEDWGKIKDKKLYVGYEKYSDIFYVKIYFSGNKYIRLHRFITDCPDGMYVDHINHDTFDNRKSNLRICSNSENCRNTRKHKDNINGYKGITWLKKRNKWQVRIKVNYKGHTIGYFDDKIEAAKVYNQAALKYFGEFACLNIIPDKSGQGAA